MKQEIGSFYSNHLSHILILVLLVPLLLLIYFPSSSTSKLILAQTTSVENVEEYKNTLFGLSIDYPSNWIIDEFEKRIKNEETIGINNIVQLCPNTNTLKPIQSDLSNNNATLCKNTEKSFAVYVHNLPPGMTLEEFTNSKISSYKLELTDFKIIESNPNIMIDDNSAYKVTYTYTDNKDKKVQVMEVWTVINDDKDRDEL